jgi:hypothetical protein
MRVNHVCRVGGLGGCFREINDSAHQRLTRGANNYRGLSRLPSQSEYQGLGRHAKAAKTGCQFFKVSIQSAWSSGEGLHAKKQ